MLALPFLVLALFQSPPQSSVYYRVALEELELASGSVLPRSYAGNPYGGGMPWDVWGGDVLQLPWASVEGGEAVYVSNQGAMALGTNQDETALGQLFLRADSRRDLTGTLFVPRANGGGFLRLPFKVPSARATSTDADFIAATYAHYERLRIERLPGGAWFRQRADQLRPSVAEGRVTNLEARLEVPFREPDDPLSLFSGGRALYENLQLERGLPQSEAAEPTVALDTLEGITVRAIDWKPRLAPGETRLDALAALVPADQHALFFPSFAAFTDTLDEADRLSEFGLSTFEERSSDAHTKERTERQLGLELSDLARLLGPLVIESVALTGSDPYLRSGSDRAFLSHPAAPNIGAAYCPWRPRLARGDRPELQRHGELAGIAYRGIADETRSVSSYLATVGETVVVTNSLVQLERIAQVAGGAAPALAAAGEYRFFRQRYALGSGDESAFAVLPDDAIRRWCSPRWRIAAARRVRAAAELIDEQLKCLSLLVRGIASPPEQPLTVEWREFKGIPSDFPELGTLRLTPDGVHSERYGTLDFLTPIAELPLERVTQREADLYRTWREGYERAWSNFFDPIGARLSIGEKTTRLDLTVMPLILGSDYAGLRDATRGPGLAPGSGDPHPEALVHFVMGIDPEWEALKSLGSILGSAAEKLGADPFSWLGNWLAVYADEGPFWDDLLQAEDLDEALEGVQGDLSRVPLALAVGVRNPLKLALFMTSLRAFVDGTAPGMSEWKERVAEADGKERRFVEIHSPGFGEAFSLFYATTPTALIFSLHEPTLLAAMGREERRRAGETAPATIWGGAHAALELRRRGLDLAEVLLAEEVAEALRRAAWLNLPILNEWHRFYPELDPVELHERVFRERLECPGGGSYVWNDAWQTMESSVFGHPGEPKPGVRRPRAWDELEAVRFALEFEDDGLRVRGELERK